MIWASRTIVALVAAGAGVIGAQAPEFAQQYKQRLGGALTELRAVVDNFDQDASRNNLTRVQALDKYKTSDTAFLRDRGLSMASTIARYKSLSQQASRFSELPEMTQPTALLMGYDEKVMSGAWHDFKPALPVTVVGALWALTGLLIGWAFGHGATVPLRRRVRRKNRAVVSESV